MMAAAPHPATYRVRLSFFEGPLDLLLHLIRRQKLDIHDIPISVITEQYLQHLDLMRELNLDVAGEFLVMAASLIQIKTRMLLPREPAAGEEDEDDPRADLVRRLVEYEQYRAAGMQLRLRLNAFADLFPRPPDLDRYADFQDALLDYDLNVFDLLLVFKEIIEHTSDEEDKSIQVTEFNIQQRMIEVMDFLTVGQSVPLDQLVNAEEGRIQLLLTFLAVLELVRLRAIRFRQRRVYGPILLTRAVEEFEHGE